MTNRTYTIVLERDAEVGGFVATCPALPGVVTEGETVEETITMAKDAIQGYLESLQKDGMDIPEEHDALVSSVKVSLVAA